MLLSRSVEWRLLGTTVAEWTTVGHDAHLLVGSTSQGRYQCLVRSSEGTAMSNTVLVRRGSKCDRLLNETNDRRTDGRTQKTRI
jgi:hypothetical protein